jgi:hypothetical protein
VLRRCGCGGAAGPTGKCAECRKKRLGVQRSAAAAGPAVAPPIVHDVLRSPGAPLDPAARAALEPRFGHSFADVRVHADARAAESAQAVGAHAYAVGRHLVFGAGRYAPGTSAGDQLLAHELAHAAEQGFQEPAGAGALPVGALDDPAEARADRMAGAALASGTASGPAAGLAGRAPLGLRRQEAPAPNCATLHRPARSFRALVDLVRAAEAQLSACGYTTADARIHVLRGIYYGTTWSADYAVEQSAVRNLGFQTYTASTTPDDPRSCLRCGMFDALRGSQDVVDGTRRVDFGHLIIGMDARRSYIARNIPIPSQGATGLAISTWVGDLGGGAGMLALSRVTTPTRRAVDFFRGTDFGGSINLEGDVAGYAVAPTAASPGTLGAPQIAPGGMIADALDAYFFPPTPAPGASPSGWNSRCTTFLQMMGGTFAGGALTNRAAVISALAPQIQAFACWYLVNRLRQTGRLTLTILESASLHVDGAGREVAEVFVDALDDCARHPSRPLQASGTGPAPSPPGLASGFCQTTISGMRRAEQLDQLRREGERLLERGVRGAEDLIDDVGGTLRDAWRRL